MFNRVVAPEDLTAEGLLALRGVDLCQADTNRVILYKHVDGVAIDHTDN